jgi:hypothetical protein
VPIYDTTLRIVRQVGDIFLREIASFSLYRLILNRQGIIALMSSSCSETSFLEGSLFATDPAVDPPRVPPVLLTEFGGEIPFLRRFVRWPLLISTRRQANEQGRNWWFGT